MRLFQVSFCITDKAVCVYRSPRKIDTQLHTEVKVEEIFKVFPRRMYNTLLDFK